MWSGPNRATLSVVGLYNYDESLFDNLTVPDGITKSEVVNNILLECAELEILYPDYDFLKTAIGIWSAEEQNIWERVYYIESLEYSPIENYDRYESENATSLRHENVSKNRATERSGSGSTTDTGTGSNTHTEAGTSANDQINKVAGINSNTVVNKAETVDSGSTGLNSADTQQTSRSSSGSTTDSETGHEVEARKDNGTEIRNSHIHGNIGVTTAQQMIEAELALLPKKNTVAYIVESFKNKFCILVY